MITLFTTPSQWGLPAIGPACLKLETWLRMVELPYERITRFDIQQAPKGKIPFIEYEGKLIGDSTLIIHLLQNKYGVDIDAHLNPTERATSLAFSRMVQEHTYWSIVYLRYGLKENWYLYRETVADLLFPDLPQETWEPFVEQIRDLFLNQLHSQGLGRHQDEEIYQIIRADLQALSDFLSDQPFFFHSKPTMLDLVVFACVGNIIQTPFKGAIVDCAVQFSNLCQHYDRMAQQFFPEFSGCSNIQRSTS